MEDGVVVAAGMRIGCAEVGKGDERFGPECQVFFVSLDGGRKITSLVSGDRLLQKLFGGVRLGVGETPERE